MSAKRSYQRALHLVPWQANLYIDIGITLDLISSMNENYGLDLYPWYDMRLYFFPFDLCVTIHFLS